MSISKLLVTHLKRKAEEERDTQIRSFAVRRSALIEMVLFFVVALAIDYIFLDGNRYQTVSPHPFWLIVLLMCFQYGTNEGIAAALSSTIILLAWNLPEQSVQQDQYGYLLDISLGPISWMVASVLFGELRMRQINERDELRQTAAEAAEREAVITKQYEDLQQIKQTLESRVAGQLSPHFPSDRTI